MIKNAKIGRKKANLVIRFGGQDMSLEQVLLSTAQKKAHHMVRDCLMKDFNPNRSLGPISSGDVKVFSCSPESKECLPLIYGSHKT